MDSHRLAFVGAGPSCTYVLERLAATVTAAARPVPLGIHIFDRSGQFGAGQVHSTGQPVTSFLNRIVGQVAFAADETVVGAGPLLPQQDRPTLLEWCRAAYEKTEDPVFDLVAEDWPKRYVHGLALADQFQRYVRMLRGVPGVEVHLHHAEVADLEELPDGRLGVLNGDGERVLEADQVLMLTGHSSNDPARYPRQTAWARFAASHPAVFVPSAYPLEEAFEPGQAGPGSTVGCIGMGLTGIDVILHLSEGRGGVFEKQPDGTLEYRASGREPDSIVMFSRAGLFTFARPYNAKERNPRELEHRGVFLTEDAVSRLRQAVGTPVTIGGFEQRQLDFRDHIFPVIVLEMAYLYYTTLLGSGFGRRLAAAARPTYEAFLADGGRGDSSDASVRRLLAPLEALVDQATHTVDSVLSGEVELAEAKKRDGDAEALVRRFLDVVFDVKQAAAIATHIENAAELADAVASAKSPWRHPKSVAAQRFSWERSIRPIDRNAFTTPEEYREAMLDFLDLDHRWAAQDNLTNPAKAAADGVWRDLRDVLATALDFGGLHAESHRDFLDIFMRHHNRLCNGAALEVMEKVRALIRCGLVDITAGPGADVTPEERSGRFVVGGPATGAVLPVDILVDSRVHPFDAENDVLPLYPNLLRRGLVRKWRNPAAHGPDFAPGGLDLTADFHPLRADGEVDQRLTLLGPPSEGVMFFQLGALRPQQNHHVMQDILRWIREFWAQEAMALGAPGGRGGARGMSSTPVTTSAELRARIEEITNTHARLLADTTTMDDVALRQQTGLPGWTRGHVLTHLGDLARAFARQARYAPEGRRVEVYDGGRPGRDAAIEQGASRPAAALREALEDGLTQLEQAWAEIKEADWRLPCAYRDSDLLATQLCWWREVHIHYADLDTGYGSKDWSDPLSRHVIDYLLPRLPAARTTVLFAADTGRRWEHGTGASLAVHGTQNALAAWLAGRRTAQEPEPQDHDTPLPELGRWP